ncbi:hypothetical protein [Streptococcus suis]|uniref:hypothetical protein n=1 Tax=Streptococcus suis TaxID=1307 RepID=UPI001EF01F1C|nr:hypothetical protein [Streptococcus suis]
MSLTPSIRRNKEVQALQTIASPYQMEVARKLSQKWQTTKQGSFWRQTFSTKWGI